MATFEQNLRTYIALNNVSSAGTDELMSGARMQDAVARRDWLQAWEQLAYHNNTEHKLLFIGEKNEQFTFMMLMNGSSSG